MVNNIPIVSIGLPVYNGENFIGDALTSLLAQTFEDFELIVLDNASTDRTREICSEFSCDPRVRYLRNEKNLGGSWNHNHVFELSRSKYFKWASHDDIVAPSFLERCVKVLDADPSVILAYSRSQAINEKGVVFRTFDAKTKLGSEKPHKRFFECICVPHPQIPVFGLVRSNIFKKTRLLENYASSDRTILGELSLRGRFYEIEDVLFFKRYHSKNSFRAFSSRHAQAEWFDPTRVNTITFPHWRLLFEHFTSIQRVPLNLNERLKCYGCMLWWMRLHYKNLFLNLFLREIGRKNQKATVRGPGFKLLYNRKKSGMPNQ